MSSNLNVIRVPVWISKRKSTTQRIGFYLSFMISAIYVVSKLPKFDVIIASSPPLFVGIPVVIISKLKKTPVYMDIRDLWTESAVVHGELNSVQVIKIAQWLERTIYKYSRGFLLAVSGWTIENSSAKDKNSGASEGLPTEVIFPQNHHPGILCQSNFTRMESLKVTINSVPFNHMIFHFVLTWSNWETGFICYSESFGNYRLDHF